MLEGDTARSACLTEFVLAQSDLRKKLRAEALLTRCASSLRSANYREALPDCDRAEALLGRSWRICGMAHLGRGDAEGAVTEFHSALREDRQPLVLRRGLRAALRARSQNE